jgi:hypothetical protein
MVSLLLDLFFLRNLNAALGDGSIPCFGSGSEVRGFLIRGLGVGPPLHYKGVFLGIYIRLSSRDGWIEVVNHD